MPRFYKRKEGAKARMKINEENMKAAVAEAIRKERPLQAVAKTHGVDRMTLKRYIKKYEADPNASMTSNYLNRLIFSREQEEELVDYIKFCAKINHGLTLQKIRDLAYEIAVKNNIKKPAKWDEKRTASIDWIQGFMHRNKSISLRTPEATSLTRATSFNKNNVMTFFNNLENILTREQLSQDRIWNVDETGCSTVQKTKKVIAAKGQKQVGQVTSAERGQLITMCATISASGQSIPPFMVFPRVNLKPAMLNGAPDGSSGAANISGWMSTNSFNVYLQHFATCVGVSKNHKVLLIMDNHESHISIQSLQFCKDNGIILLTLPPHCSHKLQPLDVGVFGPFKNAYDRAANEWMSKNPGRIITIYDVSYIIGKAYPLAFTATNILNSFKKTGIQPFDSLIFTDNDFLCAYVTDRPENEPSQITTIESCTEKDNNKQNSSLLLEHQSETDQTQFEEARPPNLLGNQFQVQQNEEAGTSCTSLPGPSNFSDQVIQDKKPEPSSASRERKSSFLVSPTEVIPFPKAGPRTVVNRKGRKKLKSAILTDTPVKQDLEADLKLREEKKKKKADKTNKQNPKDNKPKERVKKRVFSSSSSEGELSLRESEDSLNEFDEEFEELRAVNSDNLKKGKFIVVRFKGGKRMSSIYRYLCIIDQVDYDDLECRVISLRCADESKKLFSLVESDISDVEFEDILGLAPDPNIILKGERMYYSFMKALDIFESV